MSPVIKEHARARLVTDAPTAARSRSSCVTTPEPTPTRPRSRFPGGARLDLRPRTAGDAACAPPPAAATSGSGRAAGPSWSSNCHSADGVAVVQFDMRAPHPLPADRTRQPDRPTTAPAAPRPR